MTGPQPDGSRPSRSRLLPLFVVAPVAVQAAIVAVFGQAVQAWDEYYYADLFVDIGHGRPWLWWMFRQHNEHRIVWTKMAMLGLGYFTDWNPVAEMYVSAVLVGLVAFGIWNLYRTAVDEPAWRFWPVPLLLCIPAQHMNMLYGLMTCHYFTVAGMVWTLVFLLRKTRRSFVAAIAASFVALFSTLNGIIVFPIGFVVLCLNRQSVARRRAWLLASATLVAAYFSKYQVPAPHQPTEWTLDAAVRIALAALTSLGSPFAGSSIRWSIVVGVAMTLLIVMALFGTLATAKWTAHAGLIGLTLIGVGSAAVIGLGRYRFGLEGAAESKYVTYTIFAMIGIVLSLAGQRNSQFGRTLLLACGWLVGVGWVVAAVTAYPRMEAWGRTRRLHRYEIQNIQTQPDENLRDVYHLSEVRRIAACLQAAKLGPCRKRVDALLVARPLEGLPTKAIVRGSELVSKILCPVDTLRDVGVLITPAAAGGQGVLNIDIDANDRKIVGAVVELRAMRGSTWVPVRLSAGLAVRRGDLLVVRVSSDSATGAGAPRAMSFPVYSSQITRQGGALLAGRDLGLAFNGFANGLLP
ncbi:MAG: hypothetical protein ABIT01_16270 [Thermoanaerobaculia bacterium]